MSKLLSEFTVGESGKIIAVNGEGKIRRRLFDMGVTPGAELTMKKKAPLGAPMAITFRGSARAWRRTAAACVAVDG